MTLKLCITHSLKFRQSQATRNNIEAIIMFKTMTIKIDKVLSFSFIYRQKFSFILFMNDTKSHHWVRKKDFFSTLIAMTMRKKNIVENWEMMKYRWIFDRYYYSLSLSPFPPVIMYQVRYIHFHWHHMVEIQVSDIYLITHVIINDRSSHSLGRLLKGKNWISSITNILIS